MRCKICGHENPENAKFCGYCRHNLTEKTISGKKLFLIVGILVLCVIGTLCTVFLKENSENNEVTDVSCQHVWQNSGGEFSVCTKCGAAIMTPVEDIVQKRPEKQEKEEENVSVRKNQLMENAVSHALEYLETSDTGDLRSISFVNSLDNISIDYILDVSAAQDGSVIAWYQTRKGANDYDLYIGAEGDIIAPENCTELFSNIGWAEEIHFNNCFDTSNVTNMSYMFAYCMGLEELDLSCFDTSKVTDMSEMFFKTFSLKKLDVSSFDTSSVTSMFCMFSQSSLEEVELSSFDTSNVTDMSGMFEKCQYLKRLDLSNFTTSDQTNITAMFYQCMSLEELDIRGFDLSGIPQEEIPSVLFMGSVFPKLFITNDNLMESGKTHYDTLAGDWSSERVAVGGTSCYPWIFDEAVDNCTGFTMHYQITNINYGKVYGTYGLYRKTQQNNWERIGTFEVSDQSEIIKTFEFDDPISFTALAVAAPAGRSFNFDSLLWFDDWYLVD